MTIEEPSYMMFARANVKDGLMSTPSVVKELLARIDRLERGPKAMDFPQRVDVTREGYVEGTLKVRDLINDAVNGGAVAAVYVQPLEKQ